MRMCHIVHSQSFTAITQVYIQSAFTVLSNASESWVTKARITPAAITLDNNSKIHLHCATIKLKHYKLKPESIIDTLSKHKNHPRSKRWPIGKPEGLELSPTQETY
jgi:hypothetical protein